MTLPPLLLVMVSIATGSHCLKAPRCLESGWRNRGGDVRFGTTTLINTTVSGGPWRNRWFGNDDIDQHHVAGKNEFDLWLLIDESFLATLMCR